ETTGENWLEAGGIAGINVWGLMANTYATGDVTVSLYDHEQGQAEDETGGAAGGLCGLEYGEEHNCYAAGNVNAVKKIDCIGALAGSFVKNSVVKNSWYNTQAVLSNGGETIAVNAPSQSLSGTSENNNGFAAGSADAYRVKTALNRVVRAQESDFSNYGVQASDLNTWTMQNGTLVQGNTYVCDGDNCPSASLQDVDKSAWYHEAVDTALASGTMNGVGNALFAPNQTLNRAMLVQILYNEAGNPEVKASDAFQDVAADSWYAKAVAWAAQNGIVSGYGNGKFGPTDAVTREQAVQILYAYAQKQGADVSAQADLGRYTDAGTLSSWAQNAMRWAVAKQIVSGTSQSTLSPRGTTTRAQAAQLMMRFFESV
ncbi:S-layer homology domain-containing protein, partial [Butyricicoccus sp.]|uniref:S-layer homology domain-containing protein n=1 Tax=Butyricicoccus sp. TaxID=2049021 RepID=UPI003D7DAB14